MNVCVRAVSVCIRDTIQRRRLHKLTRPARPVATQVSIPQMVIQVSVFVTVMHVITHLAMQLGRF